MDIRLYPLEELLKLAIFSAYIKGKEDKSVSICIVAEPELNKTRSLLLYSNSKGLTIQTDLTYIGIVNHILPKIKAGTVNTIVIPDMLKTIQKRQATASNFIGILNSLIEEGVYDVTLRDTISFGGARANIITSLTPELFYSRKLKWNRMGLLSRFIPFTYAYSKERTEAVFRAIRKKEINQSIREELELPIIPEEVFISEDMIKKIKPFRKALVDDEITRKGIKDGVPYYTKGGKGFRHEFHFQTLLKASALARGETEVTIKDFDKIKWIAKWINYQHKEI